PVAKSFDFVSRWALAPLRSRSSDHDPEVSCVSSSAPKRRLDVRQQTPQGVTGKRASTPPRRRRRTLRPTPAMLGALVLVVAGIGSAVVSSDSDGGAFKASYQTLSASYDGAPSTGDDVEADVDVSRSFDRELLEQQAEQQ